MANLYSRKGQSAIEYLTTYGWMLLVVAIVGAAIFTTIGDTGESQPDVQGFGDDVAVQDPSVTTNGDLVMSISTRSDGTITVYNASLSGNGNTAYMSGSNITLGNPDEAQTLTIPGVSGDAQGTSSFDLAVNYTDSDLTGSFSSTGTIEGTYSIQ